MSTEIDIEEVNKNICPLCKRQYCFAYGIVTNDKNGGYRKITCIECGRNFREYLKTDRVELIE